MTHVAGLLVSSLPVATIIGGNSLQSVRDIENNTWAPGDMKFLFECSTGFKADRLQMIVVAKKHICVATVHQ